METFLSIIGVALATASFVYAIMTNRDKARIENSLKSHLGSTALNIVLVRKNSEMAHRNVDRLLKLLKKKPNDLEQILEKAIWAQSDITAADRTLEILLSDILSLQEGLFGTRSMPKEPPKADIQNNYVIEPKGSN